MVQTVFRVYYLILIARVILSWVRVPDNAITRFLYEVTEPPLALIRRILPPTPGLPLDFSPIILIVAMEVIERVLVRLLVAL